MSCGVCVCVWCCAVLWCGVVCVVAGHGEQGVLAFENNFGVLQWVSHQEVSEMCRGLADKPELVFLSACYGLTVS
jgi:hypothetical protein